MMPTGEQHTRAERLQNHKGFTLLEIIVTLILISITGVVMFPVLRTNLTKSAVPVVRLDSQYHLVQAMDRLTACYRDKINIDPPGGIISAFSSDCLTDTDVSPFVDAGSTGSVTGQIIGISYNPQSTNILRVTLVDGDQSLVSYFTE